MSFECVGELSVSDSDTLSNRGTEPIIRFRLGFVLKLGLVIPVSIIGIGMGSRFLFVGFQVWILKQANLGPFIISMNLTFSISLTGGGGSWERFSHSSGGNKIIRCKANLIVIN
jgi:hypothetical protein